MKTEETYRSNLQQEEEKFQLKRQEFERNRRQWEENSNKIPFQDTNSSTSYDFLFSSSIN